MKKEARPLVLVTGGTGFLGAHLVRMLGSQNKARLRVLVHSAPPAWLKDRAPEVEIMSGTVTAPDDVARAVAGVEQIYHLAGMVSHKAADAHRMYAVHVDGTRLVCEAAVRAGVTRIVNVSLFFTTEERDGMLQSGMEGGLNESYAALDRLLASM